MKLHLRLLILVLAGVTVSSAGAQETPSIDQAPEAAASFSLGVHFRQLADASVENDRADIEVTEVFWYGCPHCFDFERHLEPWQAALPAYVRFVRIPALWSPRLRLHARAFFTAEELGIDEEMHSPIFRAFHVDNVPLESEDDWSAFFNRFGVDGEVFSNTFSSSAVEGKLKHADELSRKYQVASVPMMVVNGTYATDTMMTTGYDNLLDVVDHLIAIEAQRLGLSESAPYAARLRQNTLRGAEQMTAPCQSRAPGTKSPCAACVSTRTHESSGPQIAASERVTLTGTASC